ncbi:MAG: hypothetical protein MUF58_07355 [Arcicella sp.]|jgi:hypothetical protein|nr:hypothetical protein [Arcicella sp.]
MKHFAKLPFRSVLLCVFGILLIVQNSSSQVNLTGTTYSQDFNTLPSSGTATWANNTTLTGWYVVKNSAGQIASIGVNAGSTTTAGFYSFGSASSTDRAIGVAITNAYAPAGTGVAYGLRIRNQTGTPLASITVSYTGEQWRKDNTVVQKLTFAYKTGSNLTTIDSTSLTGSGFTANTALDFSSPIITSGGAALDGNAPANRTTISNVTIIFPTPVAVGQEIMLKWFDTNDSGNDHQLTIDDVSIAVTPVAPTLTATPTTIPAFNYVSGNGPSTAGSYTLSGSVLSPADGDITITAPADFEISKTSATTGFADNILVSYTGGAFTATTIYARLKAGLAIGNSYAGNITHSGGSVTTPPTVALSGSVTSVAPPVITTTGTLSTFNTVIGTPSASQSYTVAGNDLVSDITITAPTDFEIKTGAGAYANTLNLTPTSGSIPTTTIDVRLKGTTTGSFNGNLVHSTTNLSPDVNVAVNGVVGANCGTIVTIASVRSTIPAQPSYTGTAGTIIEGNITGIFGSSKFYVQDATGGIAVFFTNVVTTNGLMLGDRVKMTGTPVRFNGEAQINTLTCITKISSGTAPTPIIFDANNPPSGVDLNSFLTNNEGSLIKIISANIVSNGTFTASTNYTTITCNSQGGTEIRVDGGSTTLIGSTIPSVTQDITAVIGRFINATGTDKLQIFPRNAADLSNSATTCTISGGCGVTTFTDSPTQLDVVNWNIEWIGHPSNGPSQSGSGDAVQIANAQGVLNGVGADIYSLQEICQYDAADPTNTTTAFGKLLQGLNNTFGVGTYSGECSSAFSNSVADPNPQRVCVIYKNSVITKVFSRPMFDGFTPASYPPTGTPSQFWASGRKPFEFMAKVNINNKIDTILFVNLHAKSGSATVDYNRRKFDVQAMYDTLQAQFSNKKVIILGDLNDDVDRSIASTSTNPVISSYSPFLYTNPNETQLNGTRPNADWSPISKTLSDAFCASTASFPDYIDHQIVSNEMVGTSTGYRYVPASVTSFRPVVANYATTTSDHYPTIARFEYITPTPATITSVATGNWSSPTTWDCNCVPTSASDVVINTGNTVTVDATSQAKSLNVKGILNWVASFTLSLGM